MEKKHKIISLGKNPRDLMENYKYLESLVKKQEMVSPRCPTTPTHTLLTRHVSVYSLFYSISLFLNL